LAPSLPSASTMISPRGNAEERRGTLDGRIFYNQAEMEDEDILSIHGSDQQVSNQQPDVTLTTPPFPFASSKSFSSISNSLAPALSASALLMFGDWSIVLAKEGYFDEEETRGHALELYEEATSVCRESTYAWRRVAYTCVKLSEFKAKTLRTLSQAKPDSKDAFDTHLANQQRKTLIEKELDRLLSKAIYALLQSISLEHRAGKQEGSLPDVLCLLNIWFEYGTYSGVEMAVIRSFSVISPDLWLLVTPQIIARIDCGHLKHLVRELLISLGSVHPQSLVYPLAVTSKSQRLGRQDDSLSIIDRIRRGYTTLVDQALLVSEELVRVSVLFEERWSGLLDRTNNRLAQNVSVPDMNDFVSSLVPLQASLDEVAETPAEDYFIKDFRPLLDEAFIYIRKFLVNGQKADFNTAWNKYTHINKLLGNKFKQTKSLILSMVSPDLLSCRNLELVAPGGYSPFLPAIRINRFHPILSVISSKQRPRRLLINGDDGASYAYLLKGHEDLRLDERAMQLFGLINVLLSADRRCSKRDLVITSYSSVPLSPNSGILSWVPQTDTIHSLIEMNRTARRWSHDVEARVMNKECHEYRIVTLNQRIEAIKDVHRETPGTDIRDMMWLRAPSSQQWFLRRTNYTHTLALTSMVGYVIGLGDRHPANIMVHRVSGRVLHIDYGDTFEVAMERANFPERIPFRLTRVLVKGLDIGGIYGAFKITCELSMILLRRSRDSLISMLQAFVYDPLLTWVTEEEKKRDKSSSRDERGKTTTKKGDPLKPEQPEDEVNSLLGSNGGEVRNIRALKILDRIKAKLSGKDFFDASRCNSEVLSAENQVLKLIAQATNMENICACYWGWCAHL
ncbi:Serine/threonine-protein kinase Tor, partial [Aduncisulcus paluster]